MYVGIVKMKYKENICENYVRTFDEEYFGGK